MIEGKRHILVVEDEAVVRKLIVRILSDEGYLVDVAENGMIAIKKLAHKNYALCLIDLKMPMMDGKELYTFIKDKYSDLADQTVFITGDAVSRDSRNFLKRTGRPKLVKPFSIAELRRVIDEEVELIS